MSEALAIEAVAARWLMRREEAGWSDADEREFQSWLDARMEHKAAFWRLEYAWSEADRIRALGPGDDADFFADGGKLDRDPALGSDANLWGTSIDPAETDVDAGDADPQDSGNIIAFPGRRWRRGSGRRLGLPRFAMPRRAVAAAAALAIFSGTGGLLWLQGGLFGGGANEQIAAGEAPPEAVEVATAIGDRKRVALRDGSRIELNTATRMKAALAGPAREIWLSDGEAYFEVKHAAGQPFIVHAGDRTVTVLGTKFVVAREGDNLRVSVVEGRVRVDYARASGPLRSTIITGGDTLIARGSDMIVSAAKQGEVERELAWRTGMISFRQSTLADAAAEFNRYNVRKIEIADPKVASIRIGGSFKASNVDAFGELLQDAYGLRVETTDEKIIISN